MQELYAYQSTPKLFLHKKQSFYSCLTLLEGLLPQVSNELQSEWGNPEKGVRLGQTRISWMQNTNTEYCTPPANVLASRSEFRQKWDLLRHVHAKHASVGATDKTPSTTKLSLGSKSYLSENSWRLSTACSGRWSGRILRHRNFLWHNFIPLRHTAARAHESDRHLRNPGRLKLLREANGLSGVSNPHFGPMASHAPGDGLSGKERSTRTAVFRNAMSAKKRDKRSLEYACLKKYGSICIAQMSAQVRYTYQKIT